MKKAQLGLEHAGQFVPLQGLETAKPYEVFFPASDSDNNNPISSNPNWFEYWKQTPAVDGTPRFDETNNPAYTTFENGEWRYYLTWSENNTFMVPHDSSTTSDNSISEGTSVAGIDKFAFVCRHENRHVVDSDWWSQGYESSTDTDVDDALDDAEPSFGSAEGGPYEVDVSDADGDGVPDGADTDDDGLLDGMDYTYSTQAPWSIGDANPYDWSRGGAQHGP